MLNFLDPEKEVRGPKNHKTRGKQGRQDKLRGIQYYDKHEQKLDGKTDRTLSVVNAMKTVEYYIHPKLLTYKIHIS